MSEQEKPGPDFSGSGPVEFHAAAPQKQSATEALLASEESRLMAIPGVVSVGITTGGPGGQAIAVGVTDANVRTRLPEHIGGIPLVVSVTGEIDAQPR